MFGNNPTLRFPGNLMQVRSINELRGVSPYEMNDEAAILVTGSGLFTFDASSLANDDGVSVIRPNGFTPLQSGRWINPAAVAQSAENTFSTLAELQASGLDVAYLVGDPANADGLFIKTGSTLVRQSSGSVTFQSDGDGSVLRSLNAKAGEVTSADDFTSTQKAIGKSGSVVTEGVSARVGLPRGVRLEDSLGAQGTALVGESRLGSVIKAASAGSDRALVDARFNRDGITANTQGHLHLENLTLDNDSNARTAAVAYGGSNIVRNVDIKGLTAGSTGLGIQYTLMSQVDQVTVTGGNIGFEVNVDQIHAGDVSTSLVMSQAWAIDSGIGFKADHLQYSTFISTCAQTCTGWGYIFDGSTGDSVTSMNGVTLISPGSENNAGGAFYLKAWRGGTLLNPFILPIASATSVVLENFIGQVVGVRDGITHTGGTYGIKVNAPLGIGFIEVNGGDFTMPPEDMKYCSFSASMVNGVLRDSVTNLTWNAPADSQLVNAKVVSVPSDFSALKFFSASGQPLGGFRASGGTFISNGGPLVDPSGALAVNEGIISWTDASLLITVKTPNGSVRTATLTLA